MKFPLAASPFPPLRLSTQQSVAYEQLVLSLLDETIAEYDAFVHVNRRVLDAKRWKLVKSRESVAVYKQRDDVEAPSAASSSSKTANPNWRLPKMLAVGSIVIYGIISPDEEAIQIKTQYVHDELVDGRVLYQIKSPTERDPFQNLAVKWFVKAHPASVNAVVWPRDVVFIEATGYYRLSGGARIGYHVLQSVELPECPVLTQLGIVRCQLSSCFLFRERNDGATVEVYMKSHLEPGGVIPDAVAVMSSANALIGCWKSVWCAQNKRLAWMLRDVAATRARQQHFEDCATKVVVHRNLEGKRCCGICRKTLGKLRRVITCELCRMAVCTSCRTARQLAFVHRSGEIANVATSFCKNCITHATHLSAADVARCEYVPGALEKQRRGRTRSDDVVGAVYPCGQSRRGSVERPKSSHASVVRSAPPVVLLESDVVVETINEWGRKHSVDFQGEHGGAAEEDVAERSAQTPTTGNPADHQEKLWRQIYELYAKVERTYQLTKAAPTNR